MNTNRTATRLFALALGATMTLSMLAGIDSLAGNQSAANSLIARITTLAKTPA